MNSDTSPSRRRNWTEDEKSMLLSVLKQLYGPGFANKTSKQIKWTKEVEPLYNYQMKAKCGGLYVPRTGKQISEMYNASLNPNLNKGDFSKEEDEILLRAVKEHGLHWSQISKFFSNRSPENLRNRYNKIRDKNFSAVFVIKKFSDKSTIHEMTYISNIELFEDNSPHSQNAFFNN